MPPPAATQAAARLWTACAPGNTHFPHIPPMCRDNMTPPAVDAVHTRACTGIKNGHNSVTVQNRTYVYMNFFSSQRPRKSPPAVTP